MRFEVFGRTKQLERQIDEFLDKLSESAIAFGEGVEIYLHEGMSERFVQKLTQVGEYESRGDSLRRSILAEMYSEMLLPDLRGDVLKLLESLDRIINKCEEVMWYFHTEKPEVPQALAADYANVVQLTVKSVDALCLTARAFFRDVKTMQDHMHKVLYYEHEADGAVTRLRTGIFNTDLPLARKIHLRFFAERIVWISDMAEDIADDLAIYALKRHS